MTVVEFDGGVISYRPGTVDREVVERILLKNRYGFPRVMTGKTMIDIGAHIGSASVLCASRGTRVFAYEPVPENVELLRANVHGLDVSVHQKAVGRPGKRKLWLDEGNTASNGEHMFAGREKEEDVPSITVQWINLASILGKNGISHCDVLKMDCEGSEVDVIPQIVALRDQIDMVVGEIHAGLWPNPTPELDKAITNAVEQLRLHYHEERISRCEFSWTRKES